MQLPYLVFQMLVNSRCCEISSSRQHISVLMVLRYCFPKLFRSSSITDATVSQFASMLTVQLSSPSGLGTAVYLEKAKGNLIPADKVAQKHAVAPSTQ